MNEWLFSIVWRGYDWINMVSFLLDFRIVIVYNFMENIIFLVDIIECIRVLVGVKWIMRIGLFKKFKGDGEFI